MVYSYIVGRFVYKELDREGVYKALRDTIVINGSTTFMVGLSSAFAAYLSLTGIPRTLAAALIGVTDNKIILLILINVFLLVIGCLVDNIPATIILAPILLPVVEALGMSPVTFGIMLTMNLAIGFCTPPYGIDPVRGLRHLRRVHRQDDEVHAVVHLLPAGGAGDGHLLARLYPVCRRKF